MTPKGAKQRDLITALNHSLRRDILRKLTKKVMSPNQLAQELDEPLGNVSYHVKMLLECKSIKLEKTEPKRGALEHFYSYAIQESWVKQVLANK